MLQLCTLNVDSQAENSTRFVYQVTATSLRGFRGYLSIVEGNESAYGLFLRALIPEHHAYSTLNCTQKFMPSLVNLASLGIPKIAHTSSTTRTENSILQLVYQLAQSNGRTEEDLLREGASGTLLL